MCDTSSSTSRTLGLSEISIIPAITAGTTVGISFRRVLNIIALLPGCVFLTMILMMSVFHTVRPFTYSRKILSVLIVFSLFLSCYSVEFFPSDEYPNLRRTDTENVEILDFHPRYPYDILGTLVVRDFTGNIEDPNFRLLLEREARERGAEGIWIERKSLNRETLLRSQSTSSRHPYGGGRGGTPAGELTGKIGTVRAILFNYKRGCPRCRDMNADSDRTDRTENQH